VPLEDPPLEPCVTFKSKYYKKQAAHLKLQRSKLKTDHERALAAKEKMKETADRLQYKPRLLQVLPEIKKVEIEVKEDTGKPQVVAFQSDAEVQEFMERYAREDSPIPKRTFVGSEKKYSDSKNSLEKTKTMLESLKKNKFKTKHLTSGQMNQYGFVSSIANEFDSGFKHARTMEDSVWTEHTSDPEPKKGFQDPLEFKLMMDQKEMETKEKSSMRPDDGKEIVIDEMGIPEPLEDPKEKEEVKEQETAKAQEIILTDEEKSVLKMAEEELQDTRGSGFMKKRTRTFNLRIKTKLTPIPIDQIPSSIPKIEEPQSDDQGFPLTAIVNGEFNSNNVLLSPTRLRSRTLGILDSTTEVDELAATRKRSTSINSQSSISKMKNEESLSSRNSLGSRNSVRKTPTDEKGTQSRPTSAKKVISRTTSVHGSPLRSELAREESIASMRSAGTIHSNPFGSMLQMLPEVTAMSSLSDWHKRINLNDVDHQARTEHWNHVNLDSVAEFGKTLYTKQFLEAAHAAEDNEQLSYEPQPIHVLDPDTAQKKKEHRVQPSKLQFQLPIAGKKYWTPKDL
jgi:hypothetical protein